MDNARPVGGVERDNASQLGEESQKMSETCTEKVTKCATGNWGSVSGRAGTLSHPARQFIYNLIIEAGGTMGGLAIDGRLQPGEHHMQTS